MERNVLIDQKIEEIKKALEQVEKEINLVKGKGQETNMKPCIEGVTYNIKTLDINEIILVLGKLELLEDTWKRGWKFFTGEEPTGDYILQGYSVGTWKTDIKDFLEYKRLREKERQLKEVGDSLPGFYSSDKKEEIEFNNLLGKLNQVL